jgi:hypothetical protein
LRIQACRASGCNNSQDAEYSVDGSEDQFGYDAPRFETNEFGSLDSQNESAHERFQEGTWGMLGLSMVLPFSIPQGELLWFRHDSSWTLNLFEYNDNRFCFRDSKKS